MPLNLKGGGVLLSVGTKVMFPGIFVTGSLKVTCTNVLTGIPSEPVVGVTLTTVGASPTLTALLSPPDATNRKLLDAVIACAKGVNPFTRTLYKPAPAGINFSASSNSNLLAWSGLAGCTDKETPLIVTVGTPPSAPLLWNPITRGVPSIMIPPGS